MPELSAVGVAPAGRGGRWWPGSRTTAATSAGSLRCRWAVGPVVARRGLAEGGRNQRVDLIAQPLQP